MTTNSSLYYSYDKILSRDFLIAFLIGERGVGKSFGAKVAMINDFIKNGNQFIYLRRYKTELDLALSTFFDDVKGAGYFEEYDLKVKKNKKLSEFTCNGETLGYAVPLSTSNILKSTAFPKVRTIIYDEFLLDTSAGIYRYLKNEPMMLLDAMETVGRLRDIRVLMLGNAVSTTNPFFSYFNISAFNDQEFKTYRDGTIIVNYIKNEKYREAKRNSKFGKLINGTEYGKYAIDNVWLRDDAHFIAKRPERCTFYCTFKFNGLSIGLWVGRDGLWYLSDKFDPNTKSVFALDWSDHTEQTVFIQAKDNMYIRYIVKAYRRGWLRFETQGIKNTCLPLLNKINSY